MLIPVESMTAEQREAFAALVIKTAKELWLKQRGIDAIVTVRRKPGAEQKGAPA